MGKQFLVKDKSSWVCLMIRITSGKQAEKLREFKSQHRIQTAISIFDHLGAAETSSVVSLFAFFFLFIWSKSNYYAFMALKDVDCKIDLK